MKAERERALADETLDRLAREWFAEARTRQRDELQAVQRAAAAKPGTGDADGGILDWLFDGSDAGDDGASHAGDGGHDGE